MISDNPTPQEALQWIDEVLAQVNMNRPQTMMGMKCVEVLARALAKPNDDVHFKK